MAEQNSEESNQDSSDNDHDSDSTYIGSLDSESTEVTESSDEVQLVAGPPQLVHGIINAADRAFADVEVVQVVGTVPLPHARADCQIFPFTPRNHRKANGKNRRICPHCWCFICDIPAPRCRHWERHCDARYHPRSTAPTGAEGAAGRR
jgi:hypothetical protein